MKKLLLTIVLLLSVQTFHAQGIMDRIEKVIVEHAQEFMLDTKETVETAAVWVMDEITTVTKQYLIFQSINYGLRLFLGLFLVFWLIKYIRNRTSISFDDYHEWNLSIEGDVDTPEYKKPKKYIGFLDKYYKNIYHAILWNVVSLIPLYIGTGLIISNIFVWIKVTFFPKLYLVEMISQNLNLF